MIEGALTIFWAGTAPGVFLVWYFYYRDRIEPEPKMKIIKLFLYGMAAALPVALLESLIPYRNEYFIRCVAAPIIEEVFKLGAFMTGIYCDKEFDEPMDAIVYASAVALGFATVENLGYISHAFTGEAFAATVLLRALLSVPAHALHSSIWAYGIALAKFGLTIRPVPVVTGTIIASMLVLSLFNLLALHWTHWALALIILVAFLWFLLNQGISYFQDISPHRRGGEDY